MKVKGILLFATMMFANLHHLVSGIDFTEAQIESIDWNAYLASLSIEAYGEHIDEIIPLAGKDVEGDGKVDRDSILNRLDFAYHIGYPADPDYWGSAYAHVNDEYRGPITQVRKTLALWEGIKNYESICQAAVDQKRAAGGAITPEIDETLLECIDEKGELISLVKDPDLVEIRAQTSHLNAVFLLAAQYNFMLFVGDEYGFEDVELTDTYSVRLGPIDRMADEANLDHYEMTRRIKEFQQRINDPTAKMSPDERTYNQAKLEEIKEELQNPPFDSIYSNGDDGPVEFRRDCNLHLRQEFSTKFPDLYEWIYETDTAVNWTKNIKLVDWEETFDDVKQQTIQFYMIYFHVEYNSTTKEWVWNWDAQDSDTCAKFVRDSWERLDNIVEKLKCYMGESYYFSKGVRKRALQLTQLNLPEAKLFSNISTTLFKPCRITDDNDLVSTCTRENHEICAPMFFYRDVGQNPVFENQGGKALLRPKAYYRFNETAKECEPVKTFIVPYKMCQCGFRTDCGKDLGGNLTCQLSADFLRKQCRGTTAYPCKSLPLAPGRHHESCLSGYCDIEMNSCEDGPPLVLQKTSRGYYLKINYSPIAISLISVIFSLKVQYYG